MRVVWCNDPLLGSKARDRRDLCGNIVKPTDPDYAESTEVK
jgi:hypothetical protein